MECFKKRGVDGVLDGILLCGGFLSGRVVDVKTPFCLVRRKGVWIEGCGRSLLGGPDVIVGVAAFR
jgi:hypothetical protein